MASTRSFRNTRCAIRTKVGRCVGGRLCGLECIDVKGKWWLSMGRETFLSWRSFFASAALVAVCLDAGAQAGATPAATEVQLVAAREARERGQARELEAIATRVGNHPLAVYPAWWRLQMESVRADADVARFVERFKEGPLVDLARRDQLKQWARIGQWPAFRQGLAAVVGEDAELTCMIWQDQRQSGDAALQARAAADALALWDSDKEIHSACLPVWQSLQADRLLARDRVFDRVRQSAAQGRIADFRRAVAVLDEAGALTDAAIERSQRESAKMLTRDLPLTTRAQVELALAALGKLARQDAEAARGALERFASRLPADDAAYAWAIVGANGAVQQQKDAHAWFLRMGKAAPRMNEFLHGWRVRAALRAVDWPSVKAAVLAMDSGLRSDPAWRYWLARARLETNEAVLAKAELRELAASPGFYGLMAAEAVGTIPTLQFGGHTSTADELASIRARAGIQRAVALYRLGWRDEGFREWTFALRGMTDSELLAAAEIARLADIPDRAIATALRTQTIFEHAQRFPLHHLPQVKTVAEATGIDPAWVYAIIRQESRFMVDVRSRAGALGLMQLMPATAKYTAGRLGWAPLRLTALSDPETNIMLGSTYLRQVYNDLGDRVMAIAAYNAGPGRAKRWRADKPLEGAIYAETIPFNETRDYVKQVVANHYYYEARLTGRRLSVKALLGQVPGRDMSVQANLQNDMKALATANPPFTAQQ
jgi:soluble lytic murein transglycosylase